MLIRSALTSLFLLAASPTTMAWAVPSSFDSAGADRQAIEALLATYTRAVSSKNQALFETILLNKDIPFSAAEQAAASGQTRNYESFRKGVFEGAPFMQHFQNVHITQDGPLATVTLVFINLANDGNDWGWKTIQLLKLDGRWKIASEFYTGHDFPAKN